MSFAAKVVVYTTDYCPYCVRALRLLRDKGVQPTEINVGSDADKRRWLMEVTGQRTVPQIFINDRPVGGFTEIAGLDKKGELDRLLAEAPSA